MPVTFDRLENLVASAFDCLTNYQSVRRIIMEEQGLYTQGHHNGQPYTAEMALGQIVARAMALHPQPDSLMTIAREREHIRHTRHRNEKAKHRMRQARAERGQGSGLPHDQSYTAAVHPRGPTAPQGPRRASFTVPGTATQHHPEPMAEPEEPFVLPIDIPPDFSNGVFGNVEPEPVLQVVPMSQEYESAFAAIMANPTLDHVAKIAAISAIPQEPQESES